MKIYSWILAARPKTLIASIAPIICSIFILPINHKLNIPVLIITLISASCIQIGANFINDLYDYIKGADNENRLGPKRMIQSGIITKQQMYKGIFIILFIAFVCGFYLVFLSGENIKWPILIIGASSFLFAFLYTGGPKPLGYIGLGEIFVFIYFGLFAVIGSYYLQTGYLFTKEALFLGSAIGCINVILLAVNNLRDYKTDKVSRKNTLVVIYGKQFGKIEILSLWILIYIFTYFLSSSIGNYKLFWLIFIGTCPVSFSIIFDIFIIKDKQLNQTLYEVVILLASYTVLLYLGVLIN